VKKSEAQEIVGGLFAPSKMPGPSYGTSAFDCQTDSLLRNVAGSVCAKCYARKGGYVWSNVKEAHARRLATIITALSDDAARTRWVQAIDPTQP